MVAQQEGEIPAHVQKYLLDVVSDALPPEVLETLASMEPEELDALAKLGRKLKEIKADPYTYVYSVH